ncbi:DUF885 domain-containing protein [Litorilituus lipolyticus]|uniref:DUF885 domain-containing protein n=1 Tax=Litorilituus lipolyticus TaxID=2491017 RepID=A0A502L451_9GAMM|nr:DUF885 domain-containing protein [Litorilituus lipolyticus]TPH18486.1 hypothetical protein EPA86_01595 [Litorilituus lipolyticus]
MTSIDSISAEYVKLSLGIGQHCPNYVDAYYGPKAWQEELIKQTLPQLKDKATLLINSINSLDNITESESKIRLDYLKAHISACNVYIDILMGNTLDFYSECEALYDAKPPKYDEQHFDKILAELDKLVPGSGDLATRFVNYRENFVINKDKLDAVFEAAIAEARSRTLKHISLPKSENFTVELVQEQVWTAYNWFKGNSYSLIQLNTDINIYIERAIDLAAHEGYPGHHVFNALMEKHLVNQRNWVEYSIYNLFGPTSLLAEGSANYGIEVAFPWEERIAFERDVLFPIAGIDPNASELYYKILKLMAKLAYADNMVAQRYCDNEIDKNQAIALLMKYSLCTEARATQRLSFYQQNRSYVITYNYGQDLVHDYLAKKVSSDSAQELWHEFTVLLARPKTASMMQAEL